MKPLLIALSKNAEWQRVLRLASSSMVLTGANIVNSLLILLTIPLIIRGSSIAAYGVIVMVQAFALAVVRFFDGQAWQVYIRLIGLGYEKITALRVGLNIDAVSLLGVFLAVVSAGWCINAWQSQYIPFDICALFALSTLNQCVFSWVGVLRMEGKFATLAISTVVPSIGRLLVLAILSMTMDSVSLRLIAWVYAVTEIGRFLYVAWRGLPLLTPQILGIKSNISNAWQAVKGFTFWNWLMNLVDLPVQYIDSLLVGRLLSIEMAGVYGIIKRIAGAFSLLSAPLYQVIFPEFTRLVADKAISLCYQLLWRSVWIMLGLGLFSMGLLFLSRALWMPLFGLSMHYTSELFVLMTLQIVALSFTAIHPLLNALGFAKAGFYIIFVSNLIFLGLLNILGEYYALMGVIIASGIQFALVVGSKIGLLRGYSRSFII